MHLDFLQAGNNVPLCKKFTLDENNEIQTEAYPLIKRFTSHSEEVNNINEFYDAIKNHSRKKHCLLKGTLKEPLVNAPRAGKTSNIEPTQWICLDLDFDEGFADHHEFVNSLGAPFNTTTYTWQHSNSAAIKYRTGLRGHIFYQLSKAWPPKVLKEWLKEVNLTNPVLLSRLALAKNGHSIVYPLDISTCQNDKLIYIADPELSGITDPIAERIELIKKENDVLDYTFSPDYAKNRNDIEKKIQELRKANGYKATKAKYKDYGDEKILTNPDPIGIAETKDEGGDYIRVNLVGDNPSWGYYFLRDNPDILRNFKGAPLVLLKDVDPTFYKSWTSQQQATAAATQTNKEVPVVFRCAMRDAYYAGLYDMNNFTSKFYQIASKDRIKDFLAQYNVDMPDGIEDFTYEFDPTENKTFIPADKWVNQFSPTEYMRLDTVDPHATVPPITERILRSALTDQESYEYFLNWVAYIFQYRQKTGTSWIINGTFGTGKGLIANRILAPIFGDQYVTRIQTERLEDSFNSFMETSLFVFVDEFKVESKTAQKKINEKLKNIITEPVLDIRKMRVNSYNAKSYVNLILATNYDDTIEIKDRDRRFNVAPYQDKKFLPTQHEIDNLLPNELKDFAIFLRNYNVNTAKARSPLENQAKADWIRRTKSSVDDFFDALKNNDLSFFVDGIQNSNYRLQTPQDIHYANMVNEWARNLDVFISKEELRIAYNYMQSNKSEVSPNVFGSICKHNGIDFVMPRINGKRNRGIKVEFEAVEGYTPPEKEKPNNVIPISK
jgi:hypothetical protein